MSQPDNKHRIMVAGIGNIFMGDDAFGVEVVRRLSRRALPEYVRVADYGIRGLDLAYALLDDYDLFILVDAVGRGEEPGTLFVIEPDLGGDVAPTGLVEAHGMNPMRVLEMVRALGGRPKRVLVVGCEPESLGDEFDGAMGLTTIVDAAVGGAVAIVESLIAQAAQQHRASVVAQDFQKENVSHGTYTA